MPCIMIGGALVHFPDEYAARHHSISQARCDHCGRFLKWESGWWACSNTKCPAIEH